MTLVRRCCEGAVAAAATVLSAIRRTGSAAVQEEGGVGRGVALMGRVWPGADQPAFDGMVLVGPDGRVALCGPVVSVPEGVRVLLGGWVGPGVVDAHVHLSYGGPEVAFAGGLVGVRDLGAPPGRALAWRTGPGPVGAPAVAVAGPLLTAAGGYPSRSWGRDGFTVFLAAPETVHATVRDLVRDGVDLLKVALERGDGTLPVPTPEQLRAVVDAAHEAGLPVTAHALESDLVLRALDAGVDELAHVPVEVLPLSVIERIALAGIPVVSTLQTFFAAGIGRGPGLNATALHAAGVRLLYGTDLGNAGTSPGVDPRELDRLADAGLGRIGALRSATEGSAGAAGLAGRVGTGRIVVGDPARVVLLADDPAVEPAAWRSPSAVVCGTAVRTFPVR